MVVFNVPPSSLPGILLGRDRIYAHLAIVVDLMLYLDNHIGGLAQLGRTFLASYEIQICVSLVIRQVFLLFSSISMESQSNDCDD